MNKIMKINTWFLTCIICMFFAAPGIWAQTNQETADPDSQEYILYSYNLTLEDVLHLAATQSNEALRARNSFQVGYWQYRSYRANFLPSLSFTSQLPEFSRKIVDVPSIDPATGEVRHDYSSEFYNVFSGGLSLQQNLPTGGSVTISSSLQRVDRFSGSFNNHQSTEYLSTALNVRLRQSIFGVNEMKWDRKIEPLKYEEARRTYIENMENVNQRAIQYFFNMAIAQQRLAIAEFNHANNDTLYNIAAGRYELGTIGENDLLQSELAYQNALSTLNEDRLNLEDAENRLRSYLGFNERVKLNIVIPENVPDVIMDVEQVLQLALDNNPDMISYERQLIEAQKNVAQQRANRGFQANLNVAFGLNQQATGLLDSYKDPRDMQTVSIGLTVPILDWGRGKGLVKMALSNEELVRRQVEQSRLDFIQDINLNVRQFNMQEQQFFIAAKADTIAQKRYDVAKQRYLIDKITVTDMNNAQLDRDQARVGYVQALFNYWRYYYELRSITQYDFINNRRLDADFDSIVD
ncbi:MAG TPA: TolC family protein [Bacteroidales bacterium]|jgi:outer membrane protein TolC|nr:TolC family protein [Bacteroidales bacterium]HOQ96539.1 TolC family protein [Bacteroidales bacterium]